MSSYYLALPYRAGRTIYPRLAAVLTVDSAVIPDAEAAVHHFMGGPHPLIAGGFPDIHCQTNGFHAPLGDSRRSVCLSGLWL